MDPMQEDNLTQLFGYIIKGLFKAAAFLTMSKKAALPLRQYRTKTSGGLCAVLP